jgi:class 3 adenylate cyclase/tetratricopeptide (TPR) repeat protein
VNEQRKVVTVLFADVVGSTALTTSSEPEVIRALLTQTFERAKAILERHGGTVEKFIGDEIMAVFGVPAAHDDDPERALRAAFELRASVSPPLQLRIGINTGEVVASSAPGDQAFVTGAAVIVAARLRQGAEIGEIVVGELTRRLTVSAIHYGRRRAIAAKGLGPVDAYGAEALASHVPVTRARVRGLRAPLIGRSAELRVLRETLRRVAKERSAYVFTLFGAAGVGKSRLVNEFAQRQRDADVLRGRCLPYGESITWWPIQEVLRQDAGVTLSDTGDQSRHGLRARVLELFDSPTDEAKSVAEAVVGLVEPGGAARANDETRVWALRRFLERRAARKPLLLVIEDIHWGEPALLETLERLIASIHGPVLLVCLARPELLENRPAWMAGRRNAASLELAPLGPDDTEKLVSALVRVDSVAPQTREAVLSRAEGNPLYVEEFLRMVVEDSATTRRSAMSTVNAPGSALRMPPSLHGIIAARIDRLPLATRIALQQAATIGRVFWIDALQELSVHGDVTVEVEAAAARDFVEPIEERGMRGGQGFKFKHVLIRDVAYAGTHKAARLDAHERLAAWLTDAARDRATEFTELVAHHAEEAARLAVELGDARAPQITGRAISALRRAVETARSRTDLVSVAAICDRAIALAPAAAKGATALVEIEAIAAMTGYLRARDENSFAKFEGALGSMRQLPASELLVTILVELGDSYFMRGHWDDGVAVADEVLAAARASGSAAALGEALMYRQRVAWHMSREDERLERLREAVRHVTEHRLRLPHVNPFLPLSEVLANKGEFTEAIKIRTEGVEIQRLLPWLDGADPGASPAGGIARWSGDYPLAIQRFTESLRYFQALGDRTALGSTHRYLGNVHLASRAFADAEHSFRRSIAHYEALPNLSFIPEARWGLSAALLAQGRVDEARVQAELAYSEALRPDLHGRGMTAAQLAAVREADGRPDDAEALYRESFGHLQKGYEQSLAQVREAYAGFLLRQSRPTEARAALELAREFNSDPARAWRRAELEELLARCVVPASG